MSPMMRVVFLAHDPMVRRLLPHVQVHRSFLPLGRPSMHPARVMKAGRIRTSEQV